MVTRLFWLWVYSIAAAFVLLAEWLWDVAEER